MPTGDSLAVIADRNGGRLVDVAGSEHPPDPPTEAMLCRCFEPTLTVGPREVPALPTSGKFLYWPFSLAAPV
jgi:hypothetical protein